MPARGLCVQARVEAFNVPLDDADRTVVGPREGFEGCRLPSFLAAASSPPIAPGCVRYNRTSTGRRHLSASDCVELRSSLGLVGAARQRVEQICAAHAGPVVRQHGRALFGDIAEEAPVVPAGRPRLLRLIGDSVTWNLFSMAAGLWLGAFHGHAKLEFMEKPTPGHGGGGPPTQVLYRSESGHRWISFESWFDPGPATDQLIQLKGSGFATPRPELLAAMEKASGSKALGRERAIVYLSLGSHRNNVGGDYFAMARYRRFFAELLGNLPRGSELLHAFETARGTGATPSRFTGLATNCRTTNHIIARRNAAAAQALEEACATERNCAIVDLFSASLPLIFDTKAYKTGDPVHCKDGSYPEWPLRVAFGEPPAPSAGKRAAASPPKAKPNPKALSPQARQATSQKARQAYSRAVVQKPQKK